MYAILSLISLKILKAVLDIFLPSLLGLVVSRLLVLITVFHDRFSDV